jgi:hypothetical protein
MFMVLYNIEYEVVSTGQTFICKVIGLNEKDVVKDISSQVGQIRVLSIYHQSEVHRISGSIRKQVIEQSIFSGSTRGKGRPRKYNIF